MPYGILLKYVIEVGQSLGQAGNRLYHIEAENPAHALEQAQERLIEEYSFRISKQP